MDIHDPAHLSQLLKPALVTAATFGPAELMTQSHIGRRFRKLPGRHASRSDSHRHVTGLHRHVWHELCLPLVGQCGLETSRGVYPMAVSTLAVFRPGMYHCERRMSASSSHALLWIYFSKAYVIVTPSLHKANGVWETPMRWRFYAPPD